MSEDYKLYLGDCLDVLPTLEAGSINAIITDLPYGTTQCAWDVIIPFEPMWKEVNRVLKINGAFVTTSSQPFTSLLICSNIKRFKHEWIWRKSLPSGHLNAKIKPLNQHESILVFGESIVYNPQLRKRNNHGGIGRMRGVTHLGDSYGEVSGNPVRVIDVDEGYPTSVIDFSTAYHTREGGYHPTQKPVKLLEYLIRTYTNEGDTVLDIASGSGTTGVACIRTNRKFIGIEKYKSEFVKAERRLSQAQPPLFII